MGATVVPTVPTFASNDSSLTNLQNLSACTRFLVGDIRPQWHAFKTAAFTITASNTWTTIPFGTTAYDSEANVSGSTGILNTLSYATIRTRGIYSVETCLGFVGTATAFYCDVSFLLTGGGNNPNLGTGSTLRFGLRGQETNGVSPVQNWICCADSTPICCYPGDTIFVQGRAQAASVSVTYNNNSAYDEGRFSTNFTGRWARYGT